MIKCKYNKEEAKHIFFTSDTHFYHTNILKFCKRPYKNVEEMNKALIENWNKVVGPDDTVFHLGDVAFCGNQKLEEIINQLNGHIILVRGNHDRRLQKTICDKLFDEVVPQLQLEIDGRSIYLNHYPFLTYGGCWRGSEKAVYQAFGHVHSTPNTSEGKDIGRMVNLFPYQYDVGVDNNNYTPISWEELKTKIEEQCKKKLNWKQKFLKWLMCKFQK